MTSIPVVLYPCENENGQSMQSRSEIFDLLNFVKLFRKICVKLNLLSTIVIAV